MRSLYQDLELINIARQKA